MTVYCEVDMVECFGYAFHICATELSITLYFLFLSGGCWNTIVLLILLRFVGWLTFSETLYESLFSLLFFFWSIFVCRTDRNPILFLEHTLCCLLIKSFLPSFHFDYVCIYTTHKSDKIDPIW